jgi:hypothetical protein
MFGPFGAMIAEWQADVGAGIKAGLDGRRPDGLAKALSKTHAGPIHGAPADRIARANAGAAWGAMLAPWAAYLKMFDI